MQKTVLSTPNLTVIQAPVEDLSLEEVAKGDSPPFCGLILGTKSSDWQKTVQETDAEDGSVHT